MCPNQKVVLCLLLFSVLFTISLQGKIVAHRPLVAPPTLVSKRRPCEDIVCGRNHSISLFFAPLHVLFFKNSSRGGNI